MRAMDIVLPRAATDASGRAVRASGVEPVQPATVSDTRSAGNVRAVAASLVTAAVIAGGAYFLSQQRAETPPPNPAPTAAAPGLTEADVQTRIDQAAADIAAKLAEQAKQKQAAEQSAAAKRTPPPAPGAPAAARTTEAPRSEPPRTEPARTASPAPQAAPPTPAPQTTNTTTTPARVEPAPAPTPPPVTAPPSAPAPVAAPPTPAPAAAAPTPAATPAPPPEVRREPPAEDEDAAIGRVIATYARAIENKDIALFRSLKPNLSREEQRRLEDGFRAVSKQSVNITINSIERKGQNAVVTLRRRDTIQAGGRRQVSESQQTLTLTRNGSAWTITEIR
jgi:hypothetical protein